MNIVHSFCMTSVVIWFKKIKKGKNEKCSEECSSSFSYPINFENPSSLITFSIVTTISVRSGSCRSSVTSNDRSISFLYNFNINSIAAIVLAIEFAILSVVAVLVTVVLVLSQLSASDIMRCSRRCIKANDMLKSPICENSTKRRRKKKLSPNSFTAN